MSQLYLFTGSNAYALREEKLRWVEEFTRKHGAENLTVLDGSTLALRNLLDEVSSAPFISAKRMVIVERVPKFAKEDMESLPRIIHFDVILVFLDPGPDKRLSGVKALLKVATVKEFVPLSGPALAEWVRAFVARHGSRIDRATVSSLTSVVGEDQDVLVHELEKLSLFAGQRAITRADIDLLSVPSGEQEVWQLTRLLASGQSADALRYLRSLLERGEDPFSLWAILLWMLKNLVTVALVSDGGRVSPGALASVGVPFPAAKTLLPAVSRLDRSRLGQFLSWAVEADIGLKTGAYRATSEAPEEILALIDRFIVGCGGLEKRE